ncbi:hypothetical protein EDD21DRAFT_434862 [Dissophora ornata]|nr:hypothetical protein EDD21DRAFT_434862 [Dissophora ornata]
MIVDGSSSGNDRRREERNQQNISDSTEEELEQQHEDRQNDNLHEQEENFDGEDNGGTDEEYDGDDDYPTDEGDDSSDVADPVYIVNVLRDVGIDWLQRPEYATHRLMVLQDPLPHQPTDEQHDVHAPPAQYYRVMRQFLMPASSVFQDTIMNDDDCPNNYDAEHESSLEDRLSCLRTVPTPEAANIQFPLAPPSQPLPAGILLPPYIYLSSGPLPESGSDDYTYGPADDPADDTPLPLLQLHLPSPQHFPGLLRVIYDQDLDHWEREHFRADTISLIAENVSRLECSSELMVRCLDYYRRIKATLTEEERGHASMGVLNDLYGRAVKAHLLPADPEPGSDIEE